MTKDIARAHAEELRENGHMFLAAAVYERSERLYGIDHETRVQRIVCLHNASLYDLASKVLEDGFQYGFPVEKSLFLLKRYSSLPISVSMASSLASQIMTAGKYDLLEDFSSLAIPDEVTLNFTALVRPTVEQSLTPQTYKDAMAAIASSNLTRRDAFDRAWRSGLLLRLDSVLGQIRYKETEAPKVFAYWNTPELPEEVALSISSWQDVAAETAVYNEQTGRQLMGSVFGDAGVAAYDRCFHPAMHSDVLRLAALYSHGGIYIDADESRFGRVSDITDIAALMGLKRLFVVDDINKKAIITNKSIFCEAGDDMIRFVAEEVQARCHQFNKGDANVGVITGPHPVTDSVIQYLEQYPDEIGTTGFVSLVAYNRIFRSVPMAYKNTVAGYWRNV